MLEKVNDKCQQRDVLLLSMPLIVTNIPMMAGAVLKSIAIKAGYTCSAIDLNILTVNWVSKQPLKDRVIAHFYNQAPKEDQEVKNIAAKYYEEVAIMIKRFNPKIVGLSVFAHVCQTSTKYLTVAIRKHLPGVKIIIGGSGITQGITGQVKFAENLLKLKLIDYYIRGDAEHAFYEFLTNNLEYPGINNPEWKELSREDLALLPYPDYDDYDFSQYSWPTIPLLGSRGCVRQCTFCDYIEHWKKFSWRTADNIYDEMLHQNKKYNVQNFKFQDSLINGNMREYENLMVKLTEHNTANPDNQLNWASFFIFRPKEQFKENLWKLTAESGAKFLVVGIESFDDETRIHMRKKFTNEDIDYNLAMAKKYNIKLILMFIVGYITETYDHIERGKQWLADRAEYKDNVLLSFNGIMHILPNTWIDRNKDAENIVYLVNHNEPGARWINTKTGSTPEAREQWRTELIETSKSLGFQVDDRVDVHYLLENMLQAKQRGDFSSPS